MTTLIHNFDADGYYTGSSELPPFAAGVNPAVATLVPLPDVDLTHKLRFDGAGWLVEAVPDPEPPVQPKPETLEEAKARKNAEINAARLRANRASFTHESKEFACDELSRSDIDGTNGYVAINNALPQGWPGGWKCIDNTYFAIADVAQWKAFYGSMFASGNANFAKAQALKARLEAAQTVDEVNAIGWG